MLTFDYGARADLFVARGTLSRRRPVQFRPFPHASDAIRFAMEELSSERRGGIQMETDELRFDGAGIRKLYESEAYPLERMKTSKKGERRENRTGST